MALLRFDIGLDARCMPPILSPQWGRYPARTFPVTINGIQSRRIATIQARLAQPARVWSGPQDPAMHSVCARMTDAFLRFSLAQGNDLVTPHPEFDFPGLREGDRWCLCAARWREAYAAGVAPPVYLASTHEATLSVVPLEELKQHAADMH